MLKLHLLLSTEDSPFAGPGVSGGVLWSGAAGDGPGPTRRNSNSSVRLPVRPGTAFLSRPNSSVSLLERAPVSSNSSVVKN